MEEEFSQINSPSWNYTFAQLFEKKRNPKELTEEEAFVFWLITQCEKSGDVVQDWHHQVLKASNVILYAPVFEDEMDVEMALEGLKNKEMIKMENVLMGSFMIH